MRLVFILIGLTLGTLAWATDALVFISREAAGPNVDPDLYQHPAWVLWPETTANGADRILSIRTGENLAGTTRDLAFAFVQPNTFRSDNLTSLQSRGFGTGLTVVSRSDSKVDPALLLLGLEEDGQTKVVAWEEGWEHQMAIAVWATNWNEVREIVDRGKGKVAVVEYPPSQGQNHSRLWLYGEYWPKGLLPMDGDLRVPGLVPSTGLIRLVQTPSSFTWMEDRSSTWRGSNRWFEFGVHEGRILVFALGLVLGCLLSVCAFVVQREKESPLLANSLLAVAVVPSLCVLVGNAMYRFGATVATTTGFAVLLLLLGGWLAFRRDMIAFLAASVLVVSVLTDPVWSPFSPVFSEEGHGVPLGVAVVAATILLGKIKRWSQVVLIIALAAIAFPEPRHDLKVLALASSSSMLPMGRPWMWLSPLPLTIRIAYAQGYWSLDGKLPSLKHTNGENLAPIFQFIVSAPFVAFIAGFAGMALLDGRFFWRQLRLIARQSPGRVLTVRAAFILFAFGLAWPSLLPVALTVLVGAAVVFMHDALKLL